MAGCWAIVVIVIVFAGHINAEVHVKVYNTPDRCGSLEYFDALSLSCLPCSSLAKINYSASPNQSEVLESQSSDKTVCTCRNGLMLDISNGKYRCVSHSCDSGQVYLQGECGLCEENNSNCQCPVGKLLRKVEIEDGTSNHSSFHFRCVAFQLSMGLKELPCHLSYLLASKEPCHCPESSHVEEDGMCLPQRSLISSDTRLQYSNIRVNSDRFVSQYLYSTLRPAIYNCNNLKNQTACNLLLNLCVLKLATELSVNSGEEKWNLCLYLNHLNLQIDFQLDSYYVSDHQESVIKDQFHASDFVQMVLIVYDSDGRFIRVAPLDLKDLFLCTDERLKHRRVSFGTNLFKRCKWTTNMLWQMAMQHDSNNFYELYLLSGKSSLYPVPIKVSFDKIVASRWMTRRFFLLNSQIGVDLVRFDKDGSNRFIIYAKSISLQFQISKHSVDGRIYPPIISIEYGTIDAISGNKLNYTLETEFSLLYQMDDSSAKYNLNMGIAILGSFAILWSIFRTWCWMRRSGKSRLDLAVVSTFVTKTLSSFSNILLAVTLFFVINQLIIFKFQSIIHTVMFTPTQESTIIVYLIVAYLLKLIELFKLLLNITSVDIFFLDWEKPRKRELSESYGKIEEKTRERNSGTDKRSEMEQNNHRRQSVISHLSMADSSSNITIWRSYFVANEWCELSTKRRIDISAHIFVLILFLECSGWKNFIHLVPYADSIDTEYLAEVPESSTARMAFASFFYIILAATQFIYKKYLSENLGSGKLNEFIDLCSVSNISVFCLMFKKYGYYLHGLSPNGRSDVNMLEMYELLEMEESDLCSKRGLLPNTEQQTFEMYLPSSVHDQWKSLRKSFDKTRPILARVSSTNMREIDKAKLVHTYFSINRFLCSFIEHTYSKADYIVQDRSGVESLLNFELGSAHQKDNGHSFENVLLYGIEITIATIELMTFLMIDLMSRDFILAAIGTYLVSKIIKHVYKKMSRKNLVSKTLMDERFLI